MTHVVPETRQTHAEAVRRGGRGGSMIPRGNGTGKWMDSVDALLLVVR